MPLKSTSIFVAWVLSSYCVVAQQNNPPILKITSPKSKSIQTLNTLIPYSVTVSDKEDGESMFGEITDSEVYLSVRYYPDSITAKTALQEAMKPDPPGFVLLQKSNCINCHAFNSTLIGPSFAQITKRYPDTKINQTNLAKHVLEGSTGVWGSTDMPGHPELSADQAQKIIEWILQNTRDGKTKYYAGTSGSFRLTIPTGDQQHGVFILRASYTDHGLGGKSPQQGNMSILVQGK